jgi:hypothetical protein
LYHKEQDRTRASRGALSDFSSLITWIKCSPDSHRHGFYLSIIFSFFSAAYLSQPETNVFVVDWSRLARLPCYPTAAYNTKQVGNCIATFLLGLKFNYPEFEPEKIHAVGFSLGAHVLGFTSNNLQMAIGSKFRRITGLKIMKYAAINSLIQ